MATPPNLMGFVAPAGAATGAGASPHAPHYGHSGAHEPKPKFAPPTAVHRVNPGDPVPYGLPVMAMPLFVPPPPPPSGAPYAPARLGPPGFWQDPKKRNVAIGAGVVGGVALGVFAKVKLASLLVAAPVALASGAAITALVWMATRRTT